MNIKLYPKTHGEDDGFSADEILRGLPWVYADVKCPNCGKEQPVAGTGYIGGPCCACGGLTGGCQVRNQK